MPKLKSHLTLLEKTDDYARLLRLQRLGIETGDVATLGTKTERLILNPRDPEFARIYDLPNGELAVVLPARLTVLKSGPMILEARLTLPWDNRQVDLDDPEDHPSFQHLIPRLPYDRHTLLNEWLVGREVPLRPCRRDGVIIGTATGRMPRNCKEGAEATVHLSLLDERRNEIHCEFIARVDRSIVRTFPESRRNEFPSFDPRERAGLYGALPSEMKATNDQPPTISLPSIEPEIKSRSTELEVLATVGMTGVALAIRPDSPIAPA
jgi:hypothetical protein